MRKQSWTKRDPIKNYFPLPNEIYDLGLSRGAISVYSFLLRREDRKTYQCLLSYREIGGRKRNGRLLYHILPIQMSINQYYERQFQEADLALERQKVTKRLAAQERKEGANNADANA